jgi:HAE1 family hydrophobic/amphiphilic exporter-1
MRSFFTENEVARVENLVRSVVPPEDLGITVSNIGSTPGFSSIYTSNSGPHTATIQVALEESHRFGSYEYMDRIRKRLAADMPEVSTFFQSGGIQDAVLNQGLPAPIDVQVSGSSLEEDDKVALELARDIRHLPGVSEVYMPQDLSYPALRLDVDRVQAGMLGLSQREVIDNVITALTSNGMIAPSYWIDPRTGNDYMLTVQYPEKTIRSLMDLRTIPLRASANPVILDSVSRISRVESPTEVDHYQLRREMDVYVSLAGEDIGTGSFSRLKILEIRK